MRHLVYGAVFSMSTAIEVALWAPMMAENPAARATRASAAMPDVHNTMDRSRRPRHRRCIYQPASPEREIIIFNTMTGSGGVKPWATLFK